MSTDPDARPASMLRRVDFDVSYDRVTAAPVETPISQREEGYRAGYAEAFDDRLHLLDVVASLTAERDRLHEMKLKYDAARRERDAAQASMRAGLVAYVEVADLWERVGHEKVVAEVRLAAEVIRKLHEPTLAIVEWWHDQTGDGHGYICPSCRPEEPHTWSLPEGAAGVKPEGWVESYILSPCPTLVALDALTTALMA